MEGLLSQQDLTEMKAADDAGLKKRMRIVTEAIVKMVCPVFLAVCVSLAKLDMGDRHLRDSLSPLAGCTLVSGILSLLPLSLSNWFPDKLYAFSMFFIHLSGLLLMVLAFLTLLLISEVYLPLSVLFVPAVIFTLNWGRVTVCNGHGRGAAVYGNCLDNLENSVDFSAAISFILFLGLGGLVFGGQYSTIQRTKGPDQLLFFAIGMSFIICIASLLFMLVGMVPPVPNGRNGGICHIIDGFNYLFGGALTLIVLLITLGTLRNLWVVTGVFVLSVIPYPLWPVLAIDSGGAIGGGGDQEEVKPASLDLTKVTFTGFLAISVYTISENSPVSIHEYSSWFIFFTALAVNNGLGWRLLTHQKKPSAARFTAANVASFCAHLYIVAAAIPFACMAFDALRKITAPNNPTA